jgi:hypothetical protein
MPDWRLVAEKLEPLGINSKKIKKDLAEFGSKIRSLPQIMTEEGVDADLIKQLSLRVRSVADKLDQAEGAKFS